MCQTGVQTLSDRTENIARQIEKIDDTLTRAVKGLRVVSLSRWKDYKKRRQSLVNDLIRKDQK